MPSFEKDIAPGRADNLAKMNERSKNRLAELERIKNAGALAVSSFESQAFTLNAIPVRDESSPAQDITVRHEEPVAA